ncbi:MAG: MFS transporter [Pseudonocardia sp.]
MPSRSSPSALILVLASCGLAVSFTQTIVIPLLPTFPALLGASRSTVSWLVTATLVAGAVCAPVLGRLGDMYGKRRMLLVALAMIAAGSGIGALAPDVGVLLAGRVLQGAALGVVPLGISLMRDALPAGRVGTGIAVMSSSLGTGGAIGLPLTGVVADEVGWRWLFAGTAILATVQLLVVLATVRESPLRTGGSFDVVGALGFSAALVCLLLAVSKGGEWGWSGPYLPGLLAISAVLFLAWGRYELRAPRPLVDLRINARPAVLWTNVASALVGFSMFAAFMATTQVLQAPVATGYGHALSVSTAGLALLPIGAAMMLFSPVSARLSSRFGARSALVIGTVVMAGGNLGIAALPRELVAIVLATTVTAIGAAIAYSALPLLVMAAVPPTHTAAANSLNTLMRMIGTSSCSAAVAALTTGLTVVVAGQALPGAAAYHAVFLAASAAGVLAALIAEFTPGSRLPASAGDGIATCDESTSSPERTRPVAAT